MSRSAAPNALVTGGSGFIGRYLIKKLILERSAVRVLVRPESPNAHRLEDFDVDIVEGDLADPDSLYPAAKGIKTIYHVAGVMNSNWDACHRINTKGTEHLIEAALAHQVQRFIYLSDIEVYDVDSVEKGAEIVEDAPYHENPKQMGAYIHSRIEAEKLIFNAYRKNGLLATVVRACMVIGPMGHIFFPQLGYRYKDKLFLVVRKGKNVLPLIYVENLVDGIYRASVEEKAIGQIYNMVDDGNITVRAYLDKLIKSTGMDAGIVSLPYSLPYLATAIYEFAAYIGLLKKGVTSRSRFRWKHAPVFFSNRKAKTELGWQQQVTLQEGMEKTFKWYSSVMRSVD